VVKLLEKCSKLTLEEMQQHGAKDGQALGRRLAAQVREAATQDEADYLVQIANVEIAGMMNRLREAGLHDTLIAAYGTTCFEAMDQEMARGTREAGEADAA
jgi:hypothetical protein